MFYGDSCSGVAGAEHETTFAATNSVLVNLTPRPEFVIFAGDEVAGLTTDETALRAQWRYWLDVEMAWLDRREVPLYNTTSNHTTYNAMSERVFAEVLAHLPRNGPPDQQGLSYYVRRDDLLLVFVNTSWSGLGGEGRVESTWLAETLGAHRDATHKLVIGHHPIFPANGFSGERQREVATEDASSFWRTLVEHNVLAYLCSHILAFDVQVHDGVLQVLSAGAGTAHRMPEHHEYLHFVQAAVDADGLQYQVVDQTGSVREALSWPVRLPSSAHWAGLPTGEISASRSRSAASEPKFLAPLNQTATVDTEQSLAVVAWRFSGTAAPDDGDGTPQTFLAGSRHNSALAALWIGVTGVTQRMTVTLSPTPGRSPHQWLGPELVPGESFDLQLALHTKMGPGGVMWRLNDGSPWSSLVSASPWGPETLPWLPHWTIGFDKSGPLDNPFRGRLSVQTCHGA